MIRRHAVPIPLMLAALLAAVATPSPAGAAGTAPATAPHAASASTRSATAKRTPRAATRGHQEFNPLIFMSWNAPYGTPRARSGIEAECGDTTRTDTLYLSFDPGRTAPDFRGVSGTIYFHAAEGGTLGDFWKGQGGGLNGSPLRVIFDSDPDRGFTTLATERGLGAPQYDFQTGSGRLKMIYAFPGGPEHALLAGKRYGFARILVKHPPEGLSGCGEPICIEWHAAKLAYSVDEEHDVNHGDRWVTLNSKDGSVCEETRAILGVEPWKPKPPR